jgi:hypothetical protein
MVATVRNLYSKTNYMHVNPSSWYFSFLHPTMSGHLPVQVGTNVLRYIWHIWTARVSVVSSDPLWCLWLQLRNQMSLVYTATLTCSAEDFYLSATWLFAIIREIKLCMWTSRSLKIWHATRNLSIFTRGWKDEFWGSHCKQLRNFVDR